MFDKVKLLPPSEIGNKELICLEKVTDIFECIDKKSRDVRLMKVLGEPPNHNQ